MGGAEEFVRIDIEVKTGVSSEDNETTYFCGYRWWTRERAGRRWGWLNLDRQNWRYRSQADLQDCAWEQVMGYMLDQTASWKLVHWNPSEQVR
jgi:hypothetical protein